MGRGRGRDPIPAAALHLDVSCPSCAHRHVLRAPRYRISIEHDGFHARPDPVCERCTTVFHVEAGEVSTVIDPFSSEEPPCVPEARPPLRRAIVIDQRRSRQRPLESSRL